MTNKVQESIVALNRLKIEKPGESDEIMKRLNSIQRKLESHEGITAVELDEVYE